MAEVPHCLSQLGEVEIGGFLYKQLTQNPPPMMLRAECKKNTAFSMVLARSLPRVVVTEASAVAVGGGLSQVTLRLKNVGYLRTSATTRAIDSKAVRAQVPVTAELGDGLTIVAGETHQEMEHLEGRPSDNSQMGGAQQIASGRGDIGDSPQDKKLTWLVSGSGSFAVSIDFQRAGLLQETIVVPAPSAASL